MNKLTIGLSASSILLTLTILITNEPKISPKIIRSTDKVINKLEEIELLEEKLSHKKLLEDLRNIQDRYESTEALNDRWIEELSLYYTTFPKLKNMVKNIKEEKHK